MRRTTLFALIAVLALLVSGNVAFGQATASGTIQGTVLDKSQAAVSSAQVEATNKATGSVRSTVTTDAGFFRFDLLPVGNYTVKITKEGFSSWVQTTEILIGQTTNLNPELKIGAASEVIEVTSSVPLVDVAKT